MDDRVVSCVFLNWSGLDWTELNKLRIRTFEYENNSSISRTFLGWLNVRQLLTRIVSHPGSGYLMSYLTS